MQSGTKRFVRLFVSGILTFVLVCGQSTASPFISIQGIMFGGTGKTGDFGWMLLQPDYQDSLFIFNDNESQFEAYEAVLEAMNGPACSAGGGNAAIRPLQCVLRPRAAGIPTGDDHGYESVSPHVKQVIDRSLSRICSIVIEQGYRRIFYNEANEQGEFGSGIFRIGDDVKAYIVRGLLTLPQTCVR